MYYRSLFHATDEMDRAILSVGHSSEQHPLQLGRLVLAHIPNRQIREALVDRFEDGGRRLTANGYVDGPPAMTYLAQIAIGEAYSYLDSIRPISMQAVIRWAGKPDSDLLAGIETPLDTGIPGYSIPNDWYLQSLYRGLDHLSTSLNMLHGQASPIPFQLARQVIMRIPTDGVRDSLFKMLDEYVDVRKTLDVSDHALQCTQAGKVVLGRVIDYINAHTGIDPTYTIHIGSTGIAAQDIIDPAEIPPYEPSPVDAPGVRARIRTDVEYRDWFRHLRPLWRPDLALPVPAQRREPPTLASQIADRVTGKHNKDFKMLLVGPMGSGKSRSLLYLAVETAKEIATRIDGSPEKWPAYFSLDNVVIGDPVGHEALFRSLKKYNVYILDDAGVALDARNFSSAYNKALNHIFQTCRTDNAAILVSAPDSFLFDKVPRTLVSTYGEIDQQYHNYGFNLVRLFGIQRMFRAGKTLFTYHQPSTRTTIKRYLFANPPPEIVDEYERRRTIATDEIKAAPISGKTRARPDPSTPSAPIQFPALSLPKRRSKAQRDALCAHVCATDEETGQSLNAVISSVNASLPETEQLSKNQVWRYRRATRSDPNQIGEVLDSGERPDRAYAIPKEECALGGEE
jgi:hypothetical protein